MSGTNSKTTMNDKLTAPRENSNRELRMLLTPKEAANALSISERTLWTLSDAGEIPTVRFGRTVRYTPADLEAWIERRKSRKAIDD